MKIGFSILFLLLSFCTFSQFEECSDEVGMDYNYPGMGVQFAGGGIIVVDVNNDGWEDVFQPGGIFKSKLWLNQKGKFIDATSQYGLDVLDGYFIQSAIGADLDNDGFQDIVIVNQGLGLGQGDKNPPAILQNVNGQKFNLQSLKDILDVGYYSSVVCGDVNNDGLTDLHFTNYVHTMGERLDENGEPYGYDPSCMDNALLINQGDFSFKNLTNEYQLNDNGCSLFARFIDFDSDGDQDLMLLNDFAEWTGLGNKLFRNEYPKTEFTDVSDEYNFNQKMYGMGIGLGDYDGDGDFEYYITNIGKNYLFDFDSTNFVDVANELNVDLTFEIDSTFGTSWSGIFFDYDFDGDLDLFVSKGNVMAFIPKTVIADRNKFFENQDGKFIEKSKEFNLDDLLSHRGSAIFDFDRDGDLDIISSVVKIPWQAYVRLDQKIKLYRNNSPSGNWIGIKLVGGNEINRDCFGCRILFEQNGKQLLSEVDSGSGHASQSTKIIYFGLGEAKKLERATIQWRNKGETKLKNLKANSIYQISQDGNIQRLK